MFLTRVCFYFTFVMLNREQFSKMQIGIFKLAIFFNGKTIDNCLFLKKLKVLFRFVKNFSIWKIAIFN